MFLTIDQYPYCQYSVKSWKNLLNRLIGFLEKSKIIYEHQFGFQKNKSTTFEVVDIYTEIVNCLDQGDLACSVLLDFEKSFDTTDHKILTSELENYGLRGPCRFPGIVGNDGNHGKDGKFHKCDQILDQTTRNINKLCLGEISLRKTLIIKFSEDSRSSNGLYGKKQKHGNAGNQQKAF